MSKTVMMAFRLPIDFRDELIALQIKHGFSSQAMVIIEAVRRFSDAPIMPSTDHRLATIENQFDELFDELDAVKARLATLENAANKPVALPIEPDDSQVAPAIKTRPQHDLAPLQELVGVAPDDKDDALLWAADLIQRGAALKDVNSALLSKGFVGKNPSRLKDKLISLGLLDNDGGGGGGDELQTELTVKSHCE